MKAVGYTLHDRFELPGLGVLNLSLYSAGVASPGGLGAGTGPSIGGQRQVHSDGRVQAHWRLSAEVWRPCADTDRLKVPTGRLLNRYSPVALALVVTAMPVATFDALISTLTTAAPWNLLRFQLQCH